MSVHHKAVLVLGQQLLLGCALAFAPDIYASEAIYEVEAESFVSRGGYYLDGQPFPVSVYSIAEAAAINYVNRGDYVEFKLDVREAGEYKVDYFMGTGVAIGSKVEFLVEREGDWISQGMTTVPPGKWNRFDQLSAAHQVSLPCGEVRIRIQASGTHEWQWNMDRFVISGGAE